MNFKFVYFWDNEAAMFESPYENLFMIFIFVSCFLFFECNWQLHIEPKCKREEENNLKTNLVQYALETVIKSLIRKPKEPK